MVATLHRRGGTALSLLDGLEKYAVLGFALHRHDGRRPLGTFRLDLRLAARVLEHRTRARRFGRLHVLAHFETGIHTDGHLGDPLGVRHQRRVRSLEQLGFPEPVRIRLVPEHLEPGLARLGASRQGRVQQSCHQPPLEQGSIAHVFTPHQQATATGSRPRSLVRRQEPKSLDFALRQKQTIERIPMRNVHALDRRCVSGRHVQRPESRLVDCLRERGKR